MASIEFKNGVLGSYISHWYSPGGWSVKLFGHGITVIFKPLENGFWLDKNLKKHVINFEKEDALYKPGFFKQAKSFLKMVETNKLDPPGADLKIALKTMTLAQKIACEG